MRQNELEAFGLALLPLSLTMKLRSSGGIFFTGMRRLGLKLIFLHKNTKVVNSNTDLNSDIFHSVFYSELCSLYPSVISLLKHFCNRVIIVQLICASCEEILDSGCIYIYIIFIILL